MFVLVFVNDEEDDMVPENALLVSLVVVVVA